MISLTSRPSAIAPEWMSEKALAIGVYAAASGAYVMMGVRSPVGFAPELEKLMSEEWEETFGGKLEFVPEAAEMVARSLAHIDKKRAALKLAEYEPNRHGGSGDEPIREFLDAPLEEQMASLYGG